MRANVQALATDTKAPLLTREWHEHLMRTTGAPDSGEPEVEVAAAEELAGHLADDGPPGSVALLVTLVVAAFKFRIVPFD